jgi:hypothetical protein
VRVPIGGNPIARPTPYHRLLATATDRTLRVTSMTEFANPTHTTLLVVRQHYVNCGRVEELHPAGREWRQNGPW